MKPYTTDTHGRNHYFKAPKEHKVPKSAKGRRGTFGVRQTAKLELQHTIE